MATFLQRSLSWLTRSYPSPQPMTWESLMGGRYESPTGISVTTETALNYSPVWSGVSTLSRDIAKLPLQLFRNLQEGGKEPYKDHPLYRILHDEPNPEMTSFKFRETMQALCLLYGNAYAEIVRNDLGRPVGMYPIAPNRVTPFRQERTGRLRYRVLNGSGNPTELQPADLIHLSSLSTDGVIGHSIVDHARESLELGMATERFGASFFGNGSTFGGVVQFPEKVTLDEKAKGNIRGVIEAIHSGVERAHKVLVLAGGATFVPRGTNPNESQFIETRKFQINEVARWLSMPPHKLGDLENAHFTNIEEQELQYYVGCVSGWLEMWEQELSRKLIARSEYSQQTIEHNLEGVLRGDSSKRAAFYREMMTLGAFSINDILRKENMNPIGPPGNVHLVQMNLVPLERLNEYIDKQVEPKTTPGELGPGPVENNERKQLSEFIERASSELRATVESIIPQIQSSGEASVTVAKVLEAKIDAQLVAERRSAEEARAAVERERIAREQAERERVKAQDVAALAEAARSGAESAADVAKKDSAEQIERLASELSAERQSAQDARDEAAREREAREQAEASHAATVAQVGTLTASLRSTEQVRDEAVRSVQEHQTRVTQAEEQAREAEKRAQELGARVGTTEAERTDARNAAERATADLAIARADLAGAALERDAAVRSLADVQAELDASRQRVSELEAQQAKDGEHRNLTILAHRELLVDAVRRIARTETERARKRGATPDGLKKWAAAFYDDMSRDTVADMLYPSVLAHLTWARSDQDARDVSRRLAMDYQTHSVRQLTALADGMVGEEFQAALNTMLTRWVEERPDNVARKVIDDDLSSLT